MNDQQKKAPYDDYRARPTGKLTEREEWVFPIDAPKLRAMHCIELKEYVAERLQEVTRRQGAPIQTQANLYCALQLLSHEMGLTTKQREIFELLNGLQYQATHKTRIYLILIETVAPAIKVGMSLHPRDRLIDLQIASPFQMTLLGDYSGSKALEKKLHRLLKEKGTHIRGEWFKPDNGFWGVVETELGVDRNKLIDEFDIGEIGRRDWE